MKKLLSIKIYNCLLVTLIIFFSSLFSAGPLTHYYLAKEFMRICCSYTKEEMQRFILGTEFPDIRHIAKIPRSKTHYNSVSLNDVIACKDPFVAGEKFHTYVDIVRENFVINEFAKDAYLKKFKNDLMKKYSLNEQEAACFLKEIEDDIVFDKVNRKEAIGDVSKIDKGELKFGISDFMLEKWHGYLRESFKTRPSQELANLANSKNRFLDFSNTVTDGFAQDIKKHLADVKIKNLVNNMLLNFKSEFYKFKDSLSNNESVCNSKKCVTSVKRKINNETE